MINTYAIHDFKNDSRLEYQVSDQRELIQRFVDHVHIEAGGFVDSAGTHYARLKDSSQYILQGERFIVKAVIELPADFYSKQNASLKLITAGSENPYQRIGLWIDSSHLPRLQAERKGLSLKTLWQGREKIPTGRHEISVEFVPASVDGAAMTRLRLDGQKWGESVSANFIPGLAPSAYIVNRIVVGIDGAASQDKYRIAMDVHSVSLETVVDVCSDLRVQLAMAESVYASAQIATALAQADEYAARDKRDKILAEMQAEGC